MSKTLSAAAQAQFESFVKHDYQGEGGALRNTVRVKTGVVGSSHKFNKLGKGVATPRVPQSDVIPMGIQHSGVTVTLTDWNAPEYTDIFDQAATTVNEKKELASVISNAIHRREDQMIIDALDAATTALTVSEAIGGANTNMNTAKARKAKGLLDKQGVPAKERTMLVHSDAINEGMLADADATTADKNVIKALVDGEIKRWLGFEWMGFEDRDEGGLAKSGNLRTGFAYHKHAVGLAVGIEFRTEVNYIAEKTSWLANGLFRAGAVAIDARGIVEITTYEA